MIRLGSLIGLPAVLEGRIVGRVEQALLTGDGAGLRGLALRRGLGSARFAPAGDLAAVGSVSVILRRAPVRMPRESPFCFAGVKDTAGLQLGRVTDVYLRADSLKVAALEVSLGPLEDVQRGRMLARHFSVDPLSAQVLIPTGCALERLRPDHTERRHTHG